MQNNRGIIITNGAQTIGQMVAGDGAAAHMVGSRTGDDDAAVREALTQRLDDLIRALQAEGSSLPDGPYLVGDARRVVAEVAKPEPDSGKVSSLLNVIEQGTKGMASVASIVGSIRTLATGLLGLGS
ncbi:hypothetical protein [Paracraurococcus lichenis]|uniref:Uncharacterized protein n=1 Tax=Paracraurococcus lichenis TaxID=3064888 RepID=A0ABT9E194_9PROT|nr:hypothetical protein [Paracraurococcus sp. LOR1-02]MDO9709929.1 hypothetical protein [Paracraurococcus sp. LOR1-02]